MSDATITLLVLGAAVLLFVSNRVHVGVVALGAALALYGAGVLTVEQAFSGFGDQTVIFIASLFVVSEALDATGVTTWAGQWLIAATRGRRRRLVVALLAFVALLTALVTPNASVAALIPMAAVIAIRVGLAVGDFHVWAVETVDEGIELLTGCPAGARGADAVVPEGSVHRRVEDRLRGYADRLREFALSPDGGRTAAAVDDRGTAG